MNKKFPKPQRGIVYQRRVQPWGWDGGWECVLKERGIVRVRVGDTRICIVPSERVIVRGNIPRALPWVDMRGPVGA
jgi:hypothetical protein